jgi:hypothetical protein
VKELADEVVDLAGLPGFELTPRTFVWLARSKTSLLHPHHATLAQEFAPDEVGASPITREDATDVIRAETGVLGDQAVETTMARGKGGAPYKGDTAVALVKDAISHLIFIASPLGPKQIDNAMKEDITQSGRGREAGTFSRYRREYGQVRELLAQLAVDFERAKGDLPSKHIEQKVRFPEIVAQIRALLKKPGENSTAQ